MEQLIFNFFRSEEDRGKRLEYCNAKEFKSFYNYFCENCFSLIPFKHVDYTTIKNWCQTLGLGKEFCRHFNKIKRMGESTSYFIDDIYNLLQCFKPGSDIQRTFSDLRKVLNGSESVIFYCKENPKYVEILLDFLTMVLDRLDEYGFKVAMVNEYKIKD